MNVGYLGQVTALVGAIYRLAMVRFPSVNVQKEAGNTAATRTGRMGSAQLNCQPSGGPPLAKDDRIYHATGRRRRE